MKKLALALVCLVSVAFFASCDPEITNPEPTIALITGENYVYDGQTIDVNTDYLYGVRAASNSQTGKELASFKFELKIMNMDDQVEYTQDTTYAISGTEYVYQDTLGFTYTRNLVGKVEITATAIDVDGKSCHVTINLNVNQPAQPLIARTFEWRRDNGADGAGLDAFGLEWKSNNSKETYAVIKPVAGAVLYRFEDSQVWENTNTDVEKAALFSELGEGIAQFKEISTTAANKDYDIVIGTIYNGENHLIHITHSTAYERGWHFTITGEAK